MGPRRRLNLARIAQAALAAGLLALSAIAAPAQAAPDYPAFGGPGSSVDLRCPPGEALIGLDGRAGAAVDQIAISCGKVYADRGIDTGYGLSTGRRYGGNGGAEAHAVCLGMEFDNLYVSLTPDDRFVQTITLVCPKANGLQRDKPTVGLGGGGVGGQLQAQPCANSHYVGLHIRYGQYVAAVGAICGDVPTPVGPPLAEREPPSTRGPGPGYDWGGNPIPPQKPIKAPRGAPPPAAPPQKPIKAPRGPSGPSLAPRVSIAGMWDLVVNGGDHYRVQIVTQGEGIGPNGADVMPIGINGIITNSQGDHQYDGGFTAQLQPDRQMILNYSQKNGGHGTCQFAYSGDGKTLGGTCVDQDNDTFPWTGGRAP